MPPDITLVRHRDLFHVVANTPNGDAWKTKVSADRPILAEFLQEYEDWAKKDGLEVEVK